MSMSILPRKVAKVQNNHSAIDFSRPLQTKVHNMPLPLYSRPRDAESFLMLDDPHYDPCAPQLANIFVCPIWRQENVRVKSIDLENPKPSDLLGATSPDQISDIFYERLRPAFQLATLMLNSSLPFFTKLRCANVVSKQRYRRIDGTTEAKVMHFIGELDPDYVPSEADHATVRLMLSPMRTRSRLFLRNDVYPNPWTSIPEHGASNVVVYTNGERHFVSEVKASFWEFFRDDGYKDHFVQSSPQVRNRHCFDLAVILLHELAHTVYTHRPDFANGTPEILYSAYDPVAEVGFAWERYFFGGRVENFKNPHRSIEHNGAVWIGSELVCILGTDAAKLPFCRYIGLTAASINQFFYRSRWEDHTRSLRRLARNQAQWSGGDTNTEGRFVLQLTPYRTEAIRSEADPASDAGFRRILQRR